MTHPRTVGTVALALAHRLAPNLSVYPPSNRETEKSGLTVLLGVPWRPFLELSVLPGVPIGSAGGTDVVPSRTVFCFL